MTQRRSYALLLRGEVYRFGCDPLAVQAQDLAMQSLDEMITHSLQERGHTVEILLSLDSRGCANRTLRTRLTRWPRVRHFWTVHASTQAANVRAARGTLSAEAFPAIDRTDDAEVEICKKTHSCLLKVFEAQLGHRILELCR